MSARVRTISLAAGLVPLAASGCIVVGIGGWSSGCSPRVWTGETTTRIPMDAADLQAIEVRTHNGAIVFGSQPAGTTEAYVTVTKKAGGRSPADAERALEAINVYVKRVGADTQRIGWKWKGLKQPGWAARVSFEIKAPGRLRLDGQTHNGAVVVRGITGDVRVQTHNGPIDVHAAAGRLHAETHNGKIAAAYTGEDVTLITHNGRVVADLTGCGTVTGNVTTHNGSVEVVVGEATSANLTCRTHNGSIKCDAPLDSSRLSRRTLTGRLGAGAGTLNVTTHNGSVRIRKAST